MSVSAPTKPFPTYKWKWASVAPTESLNDPLVFLGVLRVFCRHEGAAPADEALHNDLLALQDDIRDVVHIDLSRTRKRNLIRNSGQYWKALGVLGPAHGEIQVTSLGKKVCRGNITEAEFAATVIATLTLPNPLITPQAEIDQWNEAGLKIRPLELLLEIMGLMEKKNPASGYLTKQELIKLAIPLAGAKASVTDICQAVLDFRKGTLNPSNWPNCVPDANDHRMAREFLLFLSYHGYCELRVVADEERFFLSNIRPEEIALIGDIRVAGDYSDADIVEIRSSGLPDIIERRRTTRDILDRSQQGPFRREVFSAAQTECLLTGVKLGNVLEAAHIIPVSRGGSDVKENGLCLRTDIHNLFDSGHIRISPDGRLHFSEVVESEPCYGGGGLPKKIALPPYVSVANISWRWNYL